jgi:hypothetical protein
MRFLIRFDALCLADGVARNRNDENGPTEMIGLRRLKY